MFAVVSGYLEIGLNNKIVLDLLSLKPIAHFLYNQWYAKKNRN